MWIFSPSCLTVALATAVLILVAVPSFWHYIQSFVTYWHFRNIVKGPSSFIHRLHVRKNQYIIKLGKNEFSISDPQLIRQIYHDKDFVKANQYEAFDIDGHQTILSTRDVFEHDRRSAAVMHVLEGNSTSNVEPLIKRMVAKTLNDITQSGNLSRVDILAYMRGCVVQTLSLHALAEIYPGDKSTGRAGVEYGLHIKQYNTTLQFGRSQAYLVCLLDRVLLFLGLSQSSRDTKRLAENSTRANENHTQFCRRIASDVHGGAEYRRGLAMIDLPPAAIEAEISSLLFHGTDTTSVALSTALWYVYSDATVLEKLREDLEYVDDEQIGSRPYLNAVIQESLRLSSPVSRRLPRVVPKDKDIFYAEDKHKDGWHKILPAGSVVGIAAYSLHRGNVFREAESFIPDRWLDLNTTQGKLMEDSFVAFGKGARACMGQAFVRLLLRHMIKSFVEQFDGEVVDSKPIFDENFNSIIHGDQVILTLSKRKSS